MFVDSSGYRPVEKAQITLQEMKRLLDYGKRNRLNVLTDEDDYARMVWSIQEAKYGKPEAAQGGIAQISEDSTHWVDAEGNPVEFNFEAWAEGQQKQGE